MSGKAFGLQDGILHYMITVMKEESHLPRLCGRRDCFRGGLMRTVKYTFSDSFKCLEDMMGGSPDISLVHIGNEKCKPYHAYCGAKNEYVIHFVLSGGGFYSANGNTWSITEGQMFLIYPNEQVVYCSERNTPWTYMWIGFTGPSVDSVLLRCGFSRSRLVLPGPGVETCQKWFDELLDHITLSFSDVLFRQSIVLRIFSDLCQRYAQGTEAERPLEFLLYDNTRIRQAMEYIQENYMHGITVSDVAEQIGISRPHLNHIFQKHIHLSVQNYLINYRMRKASGLLVNSAMSITEIAHRVGYEDPLVFSKAFKKRYDVSPKIYRNSVGKTEFFSDESSGSNPP